jgi:hypothetical protein
MKPPAFSNYFPKKRLIAQQPAGKPPAYTFFLHHFIRKEKRIKTFFRRTLGG